MSQALSWNFTIDDTSPVIQFLPYSDGPVTGGWKPWFSGSGFNQKGGDRADGDSWHVTNASEASLSFNFHGTDVFLLGNSSRPYNVIVDSDIKPGNYTGDNILFQSEGLNLGYHSIKVEVPDDTGDFWFDQAVVTDSFPPAVSGVYPLTTDNQNTTALNYTGIWTTLNDWQIPSTMSPKPYMQTSAPSSSVSMNFTGGIAVAINGNRNWGHGKYNVKLDGNSTQYNGSTLWLIGNSVLFYQSGLDPKETHNLEITPFTGQGVDFDLNDVTVYMANGTGFDNSPANISTSKTKIGVIVGPIIGAVALIALLAAIFLYCRRKGYLRHHQEHIAPYPSTSDPQTAQYVGSVINPISQPQSESQIPLVTNTSAPPNSFNPNPQKRKSDPFTTPQILISTAGNPTHQRQVDAVPSVSSGSVSNTPPMMSPTMPQSRGRPTPSVPVSVYTDASYPSQPSQPSRSSETSPSPSRAQIHPQVMDLDRIVELIARRIDPHPHNNQADRSDIPPPQYQHHAL